MKRRSVLAIGVALPLVSVCSLVRGSSGLRRVVWIGPRGFEPRAEIIRRGLGQRGFVEGRTLEMVVRPFDADSAKLEAIVETAIVGGAEVIVSQGHAVSLVQQAIAGRVPLVMSSSGDVVVGGLVDSLRRPGRRTTGVSLLVLELAGKRLQVLQEIAPSARRIAILLSSGHAGYAAERDVTQQAAAALNVQTDVFDARSPQDFPGLLESIARRRMQGIVMFPDAMMTRMASAIAAFAIRERMPCVGGWPEFVHRGALASYGADLDEAYVRMGQLTARVLEGADASEMPIEQPTRIHFTVNLATAKAIGIELPPSLVARADAVIR